MHPFLLSYLRAFTVLALEISRHQLNWVQLQCSMQMLSWLCLAVSFEWRSWSWQTKTTTAPTSRDFSSTSSTTFGLTCG
jgi:hypothetical protein